MTELFKILFLKPKCWPRSFCREINSNTKLIVLQLATQWMQQGAGGLFLMLPPQEQELPFETCESSVRIISYADVFSGIYTVRIILVLWKPWSIVILKWTKPASSLYLPHQIVFLWEAELCSLTFPVCLPPWACNSKSFYSRELKTPFRVIVISYSHFSSQARLCIH